MVATKQGQRSDHKLHMATAIVSIARGKTAWRDIAESVGISMRATFDLLKELEVSGHIRALRPKGIQNHNTKKITYKLCEDIWSLVTYVDMVGSVSDPKLKEFMLTDYYITGAMKLCREIAKRSGEKMFGYFLILREGKRNKVELSEAQEAAVALSRGLNSMRCNGTVDDIAVKYLNQGWVFYFDPVGRSLSYPLHYDDLINGIYETPDWEKEGQRLKDVNRYRMMRESAEAYDWLSKHRPNSEEVMNIIFPNGTPETGPDPFATAYGETKKEVPELNMDGTFDKIQRDIAIVNAALNDNIFFEVMYKTITVFPDAALDVAREFREMVLSLMPHGYAESQMDLLFDKKNHVEYGFTARIFRRGGKVFYIAEGDVSAQFLLAALYNISSDNAIIPERFFEKFILEDLRPKTIA